MRKRPIGEPAPMSVQKEFEKLLLDHDPEIASLARQSRDLILSVRPGAEMEVETAWGGYLLFRHGAGGGNTVVFLSAHTKHVSIGFSEGAKLDDPHKLLQGTGKLQRHVKIRKSEHLSKPGLKELIAAAWDRQPDSEVLEAAVARIRKFCLALPEATETISHGHPTFKAGKKSFAVYGIYSPSLAFKADRDMHVELEGDDRFFPTPYMANKGWLSMKVDEKTDWETLESMVLHSYRQVATAKMLKSLG